MSDKIIMTCKTCKTVHELDRTNEIPKHVTRMGCNWCPLCEDKAREPYREWHSRKPRTKGTNMKPLMILIALLCVGCGKQTVLTVTEHKEPKQEQVKQRDEWQPYIKHVRGCDYVMFYHEHSWKSEAVTMVHAGDCPNPKHGEGR